MGTSIRQASQAPGPKVGRSEDRRGATGGSRAGRGLWCCPSAKAEGRIDAEWTQGGPIFALVESLISKNGFRVKPGGLLFLFVVCCVFRWFSAQPCLTRNSPLNPPWSFCASQSVRTRLFSVHLPRSCYT